MAIETLPVILQTELDYYPRSDTLTTEISVLEKTLRLRKSRPFKLRWNLSIRGRDQFIQVDEGLITTLKYVAFKIYCMEKK